MKREAEELLTLYDREGGVGTEEYLARTAVLPASASPLPLWEALDFGSGGTTADIRGTSATLAGQSAWVDPIADVRSLLEQLQEKVASLERRLEAVQTPVPSEEVIVLRTVSREQAKEEIRELFASGVTFYISEVAERLNIPDQLVVDLCMELQSEGEIQVDERSH